MKLSEIPPSRAENYSYIQSMGVGENAVIRGLFCAGTILKTLFQHWKLLRKWSFHHKKDIDLLKVGSTLPNLANICPHISTSVKFYPYAESDRDLLAKVGEDMAGGPPIAFTRKAVVHQIHIRKSTKVCKSIVGTDASRLYPYSICQPMPTGLYTRYDFDADLQRFKPRQNKSRRFKNKAMSYFQRMRPDCRIESFCTAGKKIMIVSLQMGFVDVPTQCLKQWVASIITVIVKRHKLL